MQTHNRIAAARLFAFVLGSAIPSQGWSPAREVRDGLPLGAGDALALAAVVDAPTLAHGGRLAFVARTANSTTTQLLCTVDDNGLHVLARASGGGGGSGQSTGLGDPAPGGGTFGNFFSGTSCAPAQDERGSVLFLADVHGGPRALFCRRAAAQQIQRVAAVGDPSPRGGVLTAIGPGILEPDDSILFLATTDGALVGDLLRWRGGVLEVVAARGDPLPGGGSIAFVATELATYVDGTSMPIGPLPDASACGDLVLRVHGTGGAPSSGLLCVHADGSREWLVRAGDPAPGGGMFLAFGAPRLSRAGECAFTADVQAATGGTAAWFAGSPGAWRRVLGFFDPVDGGQCLGLAMSRGPFRPLDERGDLVLWCDLAAAGGRDRIVRCARDGSIEVLARRGDLAAVGGMLGELGGWPTADGPGRVAFSAQVLAGPARSAHFVFATDEPCVRTEPCARLGDRLAIAVRGPAGGVFVLAASPLACELSLPPLGVLRIGPDPIWPLLGPTVFGNGVDDDGGAWTLPGDAALDGLEVHLQALVLASVDARLTASASTRLRRRRGGPGSPGRRASAVVSHPLRRARAVLHAPTCWRTMRHAHASGLDCGVHEAVRQPRLGHAGGPGFLPPLRDASLSLAPPAGDDRPTCLPSTDPSNSPPSDPPNAPRNPPP